MSDQRQSTLSHRPRTAIVISGGGARGAYQVGAIRGLMEQGFLPPDGGGIDIFVGSSAGALNAAALAACADNMVQGVVALERVWGEIEPQQVFRTDLRSLGRTGFQWAWDLSLGGALGHVEPKSLLDTAPLRELLAGSIPLERIDANIRNGSLRALTVAATDLHSANGVVFVHGHPEIALWERARCLVERAHIGVDHLMASSAIPIFFPSVEIGGRHFGDGCIRNTAPLSPAINLGAERIIAIGVAEAGPPAAAVAASRRERPTIAQIAGVLLDAVMLDSIEVDVEHSRRVTTGLHRCVTRDVSCPFRAVEVLWLNPRRSLGAVAAEHADKVPPIVRYLMRGLGSGAANTELVSYLLFDAAYCNRLMVQAREDVAASRAAIAEFFSSTAGPSPSEHLAGPLRV
jgi:NTE family protein